MKLRARLFQLDVPDAATNSIIPSHVWHEYKQSEDFQHRLPNRLIMGSVTHRAREVENEYLNPADTLLDQMVVTHYLESVEEEGVDVYGDIVIFDKDEFPEDSLSYKYISLLEGLINQDVTLGVSIVIDASWDRRQDADTGEICTKIHSLLGVDFTTLPAYSRAYVVKRYSGRVSNPNGIRVFSARLNASMYGGVSHIASLVRDLVSHLRIVSPKALESVMDDAVRSIWRSVASYGTRSLTSAVTGMDMRYLPEAIAYSIFRMYSAIHGIDKTLKAFGVEFGEDVRTYADFDNATGAFLDEVLNIDESEDIRRI